MWRVGRSSHGFHSRGRHGLQRGRRPRKLLWASEASSESFYERSTVYGKVVWRSGECVSVVSTNHCLSVCLSVLVRQTHHKYTQTSEAGSVPLVWLRVTSRLMPLFVTSTKLLMYIHTSFRSTRQATFRSKKEGKGEGEGKKKRKEKEKDKEQRRKRRRRRVAESS